MSSTTRAAAGSTSAARRSRSCSPAATSSGSTSTSPSADDFEILRDVFKFHPLAVEDSEHFGQRAKIDDYDDFVFIVVYGAVARRRPARRGALLLLRALPRHRPPRRLPGVRRDPASATRSARRRSTHPSLLLYRIIDGLVDSFFPILADFDDRIDELENAIFLRADDEQLQEIFQMKRLLVGMRKAITPQRDMFARLMGGVAELPGLTRRGRALLPRRLRPPDPDQRPDRQLPRPAHRARWTSTSRRSRTGSTA